MKLFYKYWKKSNRDYFLYCNWVDHEGFGWPKLNINKTYNDYIDRVFDFSCYKFHIYLVKSKPNWWCENEL